jgi:hypothetical protein
MKGAQVIIQLHFTLNFLLQQLVFDTVSAWKTYILRQGFEVSTSDVHKTSDEIRTVLFISFTLK